MLRRKACGPALGNCPAEIVHVSEVQLLTAKSAAPTYEHRIDRSKNTSAFGRMGTIDGCRAFRFDQDPAVFIDVSL